MSLEPGTVGDVKISGIWDADKPRTILPQDGPLCGIPLAVGEQNAKELEWLLPKIKGVNSILEIGSRKGDTLRCLASAASPRAKIRSIDISDNFGALGHTMDWLGEHGFDVGLCLAPSQSPLAVNWAYKQGPFDFVFIDGDHYYYGVLMDWLSYGPLGKVVGFHDINHWHGVSRLWTEIKNNDYQTSEIRAQHELMGIGIVHMPDKDIK